MLILINGNMGSGKTLLMVIMASFSKKPIVANFQLQIPNKEISAFVLSDFVKQKYENCTILLDEAYSYLESRISQSNLNLLSSYILFQSRKKNVDLILTSQLISTLDKRYRLLAEIDIFAEIFESGFKYKIYNLKNKTIMDLYLDLDKAQPFFPLYNTNEVVMSANGSNDKILQFTTKKEQLKMIEQIIEDLLAEHELKEITRNVVIYYMNEHEIPSFLEKLLWSRIQIEKSNAKIQKKKKG